ncbi:MAG: protein-L-isoaspartate(D-aspartate) O-methyltransferase [Planctomycetota bacterium]|jgi:protein-L-isoaspartate(D-aspartate) O-methyltransferase
MVDEQIRRRKVRDERVLEAMLTVPRHEFIRGSGKRQAYEDHPVPIGEGQTISQPYMVAVMTELLELSGEERVLEIGTGSGYQAAILAECAGEVFTVERFPVLAARARTSLTRLGYENVRYRVCDGTRGWPEESPYDGIIVTAAAPGPPRALLDQLADRGVLVMPLGNRGIQDLVTFRRDADDVERTVHFKCAFVPLVGVDGFPD